MANNWFQFKQFKVQQQGSAMKVGTDGVLLGAWVNVEDVKTILDIGTGTGLVALMVAQRNVNAKIDAVEIDELACLQAHQNFIGSPWADRLIVSKTSVQEFVEISSLKYDLIVCNPPFFVNSLKSPEITRNIARHNDSLTLVDLADAVNRLLTVDGCFALILPVIENVEFESLMTDLGFCVKRKLNISPTPDKPAKRVLSEWVRYQTECSESNLVVESNGRHQYSDGYINLTKDFYLSF